ncbi:hypothetical protein B0H21DRAFT_823144 [Amylocystis lapponica]|nr:hypothetical protein B0H21DRAFT_823144 [Amylocystis lapponica]
MVCTFILTRTFAILMLVFGAFPFVDAVPTLSSFNVAPVLYEIAERGCGMGRTNCDRGFVDPVIARIGQWGCGMTTDCYREIFERTDVGKNFASIVFFKIREVEERGCGMTTDCYREVAERTPSQEELVEFQQRELEERGCGMTTDCYRELEERGCGMTTDCYLELVGPSP